MAIRWYDERPDPGTDGQRENSKSTTNNNYVEIVTGMHNKPGRVAQLVTCLVSHTFVETDHEILSAVIHLPSAESFKNGCCQLQAKVCAQSTG